MSSPLDCPITHERMTDPVVCPCGHTFDRQPLLQWLAQHRNQCPICRAAVSVESLQPNFAIRRLLEQELKNFVLTLSYNQGAGYTYCGANYTFVVEVKNNSTVTLPECLFRLKGDSQHHESVAPVPDIRPLQKKEVQLKVQSKSCITEDLECYFTVEYQGQKFEYETLAHIFTKRITDRAPRHCERFNILVYGLGGAGKSSLICKIATLLDDGRQPNLSFAPVGSGERHVTTKLVRYTLPKCKINVWDTWGFNGANYRDNTLAYLFEGRLPSGWEMGEMLASRVQMLQPGEATKHQRRIHAAILVLDYHILQDRAHHEGLKQQFLQFKAFTPIVVVNKVDKAPKTITLPQIKAMAAEVCCVNPNCVFVNENYVTATRRSAALDKQTLLILEEAVNRAQGFEANHGLPESVLPHDIHSACQTPAYDW